MKHGILEKLAEAIYKFDAYPNEERCRSVALALISKHPCLREPGSPDGCSGWKNSLAYKNGELPHQTEKSWMCRDCYKSGGKRHPGNGIKRPKRFEINYLPDLPEGQNEDRLEAERKLLIEEMKKRNPSGTVIGSKMDQTFPLRRQEIVEAELPVKTLKERCPALFTERQVRTDIDMLFLFSPMTKCVFRF